MNRTFRFVMAGLLALLVIAGAASVWASPSRQGTVPVPPPEGSGCERVDMIKVVFTIYPPDDKEYDCLATNITTPTPEEYGPAPENFVFYSDIFKFEVTLDGEAVTEIPTQVCYAYPPEFEEKEAKILFGMPMRVSGKSFSVMVMVCRMAAWLPGIPSRFALHLLRQAFSR